MQLQVYQMSNYAGGNYYINWKPTESQADLVQRARMGNPTATKILLKEQKGKVWTQEELNALNHYLKNPNPGTEIVKVTGSIYLKKNFLSDPELATIRWVQTYPTPEGYKLFGITYPDGTKQIWMGLTLTHLLCNLTPYLKREEAKFEKGQLSAIRRKLTHPPHSGSTPETN